MCVDVCVWMCVCEGNYTIERAKMCVNVDVWGGGGHGSATDLSGQICLQSGRAIAIWAPSAAPGVGGARYAVGRAGGYDGNCDISNGQCGPARASSGPASGPFIKPELCLQRS